MTAPSFSTSQIDSRPAYDERLTPRLVVAGDGRVVYASEGFEQLIRGSALALEGAKLQDLITFCDLEAALRDQPFARMSGGGLDTAWVRAITEGAHTIQLRDRGHEIFIFHFAWLQIGDRPPYLVATQQMGDTEAAPEIALMVARKAIAKKSSVLLGPPPRRRAEAPGNMPAVARTAGQAMRPAFAQAGLAAGHDDQGIFLDLSDDLMLRVDRMGQIITANRAFCDRLSIGLGHVAGLDLIDLIVPEDRAQVRTTFLSLMRDDHNSYDRVACEARAQRDKDGPIYCLDWRLKRVGDAVYVLCRDLTQVKAHEAELLRHQQQLSEAEGIAHMGYWRWVAGSRDIAWSEEIYRIFDRAPETFQPTIEAVNATLHRRDAGRIMQVFQRALIERNNYEMDFRIIRPDGDVRHIRCEGRCECDASGDVTALFGIMQDMTEHLRREDELRAAKDAAERAYAAKSQFLANMSHELRTPLNAIIGFSEMMQRQLLGPIGTERYLEYIDGIRQSGEHLLDLISDILDMSKIEAGKYELDLETFNLAKTTRLAVHMVEARARESCVSLVAGEWPEEASITADRRAVLQMTLNLLSNAIKFTEPGGTVRVDLHLNETQATLCVADTGIGIPANMLHIITRPFEQAANHYTRSHDGSGLGLAITKELVDMHCGTLDIESEVGKGTTVTITLPLAYQARTAAMTTP